MEIEKAKDLIDSCEPVDVPIDVNREIREITPLMIVAEQFNTKL